MKKIIFLILIIAASYTLIMANDNFKNKVKSEILNELSETKSGNYEDSGYDSKLSRKRHNTELGNTDYIESLVRPTFRSSETQKNTGKQTSLNGTTSIDWNKGEIAILKAGKPRVQIGDISGLGKYGIRVTDQQGNIRFESSDSIEVFRMYDDNTNSELVKLAEDGLTLFGDTGNQLVLLDRNGLTLYGANSNQLVKLAEDGLTLYDSDGTTELGTMDTSGLTINSGKLTVKDAGNTTILDSQGLVSTSSFESDGVTGGSNQETTSDTYVDITDADLTTSSFTRTKVVQINLAVIAWIDTDNGTPWSGTGQIALKVDSESENLMAAFSSTDTTSGSNLVTLSRTVYRELGTGTHTFQLRAKIDPVSGAKLIINSFAVSYLVLGS